MIFQEKENLFPLSPDTLDFCVRFDPNFKPVFSLERDEEQIPLRVKERAAEKFLSLCKKMDLDPKAVLTQRAKDEVETTVHDYPDQPFLIKRLSHNKEEFDQRIEVLKKLERTGEILRTDPREIIISEAQRKLQSGTMKKGVNLEVEISQLVDGLLKKKVGFLDKYITTYRQGQILETWYVFPRFLMVENNKVRELIF